MKHDSSETEFKVADQAGDLPPNAEEPYPVKCMNRKTAWALFPLNILPDIASNMVLYALGPLLIQLKPEANGQSLPFLPFTLALSPFIGFYLGFSDARSGYPFWDTAALEGLIIERERVYYWQTQERNGAPD